MKKTNSYSRNALERAFQTTLNKFRKGKASIQDLSHFRGLLEESKRGEKLERESRRAAEAAALEKVNGRSHSIHNIRGQNPEKGPRGMGSSMAGIVRRYPAEILRLLDTPEGDMIIAEYGKVKRGRKSS